MKVGKSKAVSKRADSKLSVNKGDGAAKGARKSSNKEKEPNTPRREGFGKGYKKKHLNKKSVSVVGKTGGSKWRSTSEAEKAPYVEKAQKWKKEYEKEQKGHEKKQSQSTSAAKEDECDKSSSEVSDEEYEDDIIAGYSVRRGRGCGG